MSWTRAWNQSLSSLEARHLPLACYTVHLIQGYTIKSTRIKYATLRGYLSAAISLHRIRHLPDPPDSTSFTEDFISPLFQAVQSYESVKNRKEMIYDSMLANMLQLVRFQQPPSLLSSIFDWILPGRFTGARWGHSFGALLMPLSTLRLPTNLGLIGHAILSVSQQ